MWAIGFKPNHSNLLLSGTLCQSDLDGLSAWVPTLTVDEKSILTPSGTEEQKLIGERFRKRLPGLLDVPYSKDKFEVAKIRVSTQASPLVS